MTIGPDASAIVAGGGPAGLFLAARLAACLAATSQGRDGALRGAGILLLEGGPRPGRKLLASGSGQCNITQAGAAGDFLDRYGGKGRFLKKALYGFTNSELEAWFLERGVPFESEEGGKVFPVSRRASDVLGALLAECGDVGVDIRSGHRVLAASRAEGGFEVEFDAAGSLTGALRASALAISMGGMSYPGTGSSGDGYRIAAALGHRIVPPRPALSPVLVKGFALASLAGIGFVGARFAVRRAGRRIAEGRGDVLITHEGLSGPGMLDASREISPGDLIELDFSGLGIEAFHAALMERVSASPRSLVKTALAEAGLPRRMAELFCSIEGLDEGATCATLRRGSRESLARMASAYPAEVESLGGYDKAMATAGGVSLDEVDPATMESRIAPGLFFAGEVLDYDGDTGGYNLQAAFSTAAAAARGMAARLAPSCNRDRSRYY